MLFGQKRERFESPHLPSLPFASSPEVEKKLEEKVTQQICYLRKNASNHQGRLPLPDHLAVEEVEIHPQGDLTDMVCIGKEISEELDCTPARFFIRRYIRYKYAAKNKQGVV